VVVENAQSLLEFITLEELDIIGDSIDIIQRAWAKRKEKSGGTFPSQT
jgi:hypothetical protein